MRPNATSRERFEAWYAKAVDKLKELPEGDGAFAALMIALPLYERLIVARLKLAGGSTTDDDIATAIGADLQLDERNRAIFWAMFRNGFMHQGMVLAGATQWLVSDKFGALPEFRTVHGQRCLCIDPWKFAGRVIQAFREDSGLIDASLSFPLACVFALRPEAFSPTLDT